MTVTSPYVQILLRDFDTVCKDHWDDPGQLEHVEGNISAFLDGLGELYGARNVLRARIARLRPTPKLPKPRNRTATQEKVSRCPRCSGSLGA